MSDAGVHGPRARHGSVLAPQEVRMKHFTTINHLRLTNRFRSLSGCPRKDKVTPESKCKLI